MVMTRGKAKKVHQRGGFAGSSLLHSTKLAVLVLSIFVALIGVAAASDEGENKGFARLSWPDDKLPRKWVAQDMNYNGLPMKVQHFKGEMKEEDFISMITQQWEEQGLKNPVIEKKGPWKVLGVGDPEKGRFYTVQILKKDQDYADGPPAASMENLEEYDDGKPHVEGYIGVSDAAKVDESSMGKLGEGFPQVPGSVVLQDVKSVDGSKKGRLISLSNQSNLEWNALWYRKELVRQGWHREHDKTVTPGKMRVIEFRKDGREMSLILMNENGWTHIVANEVKHGGWLQ